MNNELGIEFIKSFDRMTTPKSDLHFPRLLHVDCHGSHLTLELLNYARDHNIIIMGYVPHMTHLCQGLDVAVFGAHKVHWSEECEKHERETGHTIQKQDFLLVHSRAILRTFKKETILSAWEKTGLRPYNPNIITPQMLAPSTITSSHTQQLFPIEQPSPVRHVVKCMHDWLHTNSSTVTPPPIAPAAPLELGPNMIINPHCLKNQQPLLNPQLNTCLQTK